MQDEPTPLDQLWFRNDDDLAVKPRTNLPLSKTGGESLPSNIPTTRQYLRLGSDTQEATTRPSASPELNEETSPVAEELSPSTTPPTQLLSTTLEPPSHQGHEATQTPSSSSFAHDTTATPPKETAQKAWDFIDLTDLPDLHNLALQKPAAVIGPNGTVSVDP